MNPADLDRVIQARSRLRSAVDGPNKHDPAIRLVELVSPRAGEEPLELDREFCVVSGLSERGRHAVAATIDALRLNNESIGLTGIVEVWGQRQPLHKTAHSPEPGVAIVPARGFTGRTGSRSAEAAQLAEVIDTIEQAVLLSGAELRGADAAAEDCRSETNETCETNAELLPVASDQNMTEARRVLAALDQVLPDPTVVADVAEALASLQTDVGRLRLQGACSQAEAARSQILPGDGRDSAMHADLAVAEADGTLGEYDMLPDSTASRLAACLAVVDIDVSPAAAPEYAQRVLDECAELEAIRSRAVHTIERESTVENSDDHERQARLRQIDLQRLHIQRRLRSQQQLLAVAREEWARVGIDEIDLRTHIDLTDSAERPLPILVEEPLIDLPGRLSGAILSTLLHHSSQTQVICVSDQPDLRRWCDSLGERAGWVEATGWFAGLER